MRQSLRIGSSALEAITPMLRQVVLTVLVSSLIGTAAGAYWGEHYSRTAVALRRTRQTLCPSVPADTPMKEFPKACRDAMIPVGRTVPEASP
jgi:hypothetical protein